MNPSRLHVGAWSAPVTPEPGRELAGYAARESAADGVHDDLACRVVVFADDDAVLVLVVFDLLYIPASLATAVSTRIAGELGIRAADVMVTATHTHCGPSVGDAHQDLHAELAGIAAAVSVEARRRVRVAGLRHARFGIGGLAQNRRDPGGPVDETGTVLFAVDDAGRVIVSMVNLACHPTVLGPETTAYSRDFPGALCDAVEAGCGGLAVFLQGFAGDVNPVFADHSVEDMRLFGRQLGVRAADAVLTALRADAPNRTINLSLDRELPVHLPRRHADVEVDAIGAVMADVEVETEPPLDSAHIRTELSRARSAEALAASAAERDLATAAAQRWWIEDLMSARPGYLCVDFPPADGGTLPVQVFGLGSRFRIIALPGEPMTATASQLRDELGDELLLVGYANQAASYLPVRAEFAHDGYEVGSSRYRPGTAEKLAGVAIDLAAMVPHG